MANLRRMCELAIGTGARTFLLTIPETSMELFDGQQAVHEKRLWLNEQIKNGHCYEKATVIDFAGQLPQAS